MLIIHYNDSHPLHFKREIERVDSFIEWAMECAESKVYVTISTDIGILRVCQAVRLGLIPSQFVRIETSKGIINLDHKGEFIEPWPDDLFEVAFNLRFFGKDGE